MTGKQLAERLGNADEEYILSAQKLLEQDAAPRIAAFRRQRTVRRIAALAAVLCALLGLTAVAAVSDWFGLRDLLLPQQEAGYPVDRENESAEDLPPAREQETYMADIITLTGYNDTPEAKATAEWQAFLNTYDADGAIIDRVGNNPTGFEEEYGLYLVYTQERADKLDEITAKYGLKLHTSMLALKPGEHLAAQVGGDFLGENREGGAYMYEDGTFKFDGEIDLAEYGHLDYQFQRCVRGSFSDMILNIVDIDSYTEWVYVTESGIPVTLALGPRKALILADLPDSFVTVNVLAGTETPTDDVFSHGPFDAADLERFADTFDFSILTPARPATPEQLDLAAQRKEELEAASWFYEASGMEEWQAQAFFAEFTGAVERNEREAAAKLLSYPATVHYWSTTSAGTYLVYETVETAEEFLPFYDKIFTEDFWWNCIMTHQYDRERAELSAADGAVFAAGGAIQFRDEGDGLKVVRMETPEGHRFESGLPETAEPAARYGSAREAYFAALNTLLCEHVFPDGTLYEPFPDGAGDCFALVDLHGDGGEELILLATNTYTAGQAGFVLSWDERSGTVRIELQASPGIVFYDNGYLKVMASHNQGAAGDALWPYTLYRYDAVSGVYRPEAMVDAWDSSLTERYYDMFFPKDADRSGTGVVYYVMTEGEYDLSKPLDAADYAAWVEDWHGGAAEVHPEYRPLTEEAVLEYRPLTE